MTFEKEQLLEEGEVVIDSVRKHWIVYLHDFFIHAFGCLIFILSAYYLSTRGAWIGIDSDTTAHGAMILVMFVLIFWTSFFYAWTKDYFDVWYVTNEHLIAVNQKEMFTRDEVFMELDRIQDVLCEKDGVVATLFGYGKLKVQSAGTEQEFVMEHVRDVETVAHRIMDLRDTAQGESKQIGNESLGEGSTPAVTGEQ